MVEDESKAAVLELSDSPEKEDVGVVELYSQSPIEVGSPLRSIFCLKKNVDMREIEEREDCFILDFDPNGSLDLSNISSSADLDNPNAPDLSVLADKGQVACRDYPHSRHLCVEKPFEKTPHESFCKLCYCFVCDTAAPCKDWSGVLGHCHAFDNEAWWDQRKHKREQGESRTDG